MWDKFLQCAAQRNFREKFLGEPRPGVLAARDDDPQAAAPSSAPAARGLRNSVLGGFLGLAASKIPHMVHNPMFATDTSISVQNSETEE
ncbi:hypothetical protein CYMTET_18374 [Cymbomonas tetramitiformis]|uniref:Uncharacterized protein n=1 Tax=Cymbomonas tetramitiformis TaxID=36881 RepID=A0AAE0L6D5_9CHLO|nr:hypothetical protein CYMTET_18374 [Cymbomonas tetramitiformis]